jgi:23S rRNA pseudouridine1911/1915/1917 synthase
MVFAEEIQKTGVLESTQEDFYIEDQEGDRDESGLAVDLVVPEPEKKKYRLDIFITEQLPNYSRNRIQQWIKDGKVLVDEKTVDETKFHVKPFQKIKVFLQPEPQNEAYSPEPIDLKVIFEDMDFLVVDKPAGLVVHPAAGNWSGTLLNGLLYKNADLMNIPRAGIVHRLDKETSGLMVVAKTLPAQIELVRQLANRQIKREYLALLWGDLKHPQWVDQPIGRNLKDRTQMSVRHDGKPARTHFQPLATFKTKQAKEVSLVKCTLESGRTHQIRVHAQFIKYPLVNDPVYGKANFDKEHQLLGNRQFLQAFRLGLFHPNKQNWLQFQIGLSDDLLILADVLLTGDKTKPILETLMFEG